MFTKGMRVQVASHLDMWMRGDRYGVIEKTTKQRAHVRMDKSGALARLAFELIASTD